MNSPQHRENREHHWARRLTLQALYQWDLSGTDAETLLEQFSGTEGIERADAAYFELLLRGVLERDAELTQQLTPLLDRSLDRLDPVERSILRFACFELLHCPQIPIAVVLSEAVRLAAKFGTEKGSKYVNAVLDRGAHEWRVGQTHQESGADE